jgi:hypothetical protein
MTTWRVITPADWSRMKANLSGLFGSEELLCDGYKLTIVRSQNKNRLGLNIYVDGVWKGKWMTEDCEERRRFHREIVKRLYSKADIEKMAKGLSKRELAALKKQPGLDRTYTIYSPCWTSFDALRRHLVKNNKDIQVKFIAWVVVTGAGTDDERIVSEHDHYTDALALAKSMRNMDMDSDVMQRLPDGTLTTEF